MKKLTVVVMMVAIATFMAVMASAWDDHQWGSIQGAYVMTGMGNCLYSPVGFNAADLTVLVTGNPPAPAFNYSASKMVQGILTFERHRKGKAYIEVYGEAATPYPHPGADLAGNSFDFTYTVTDDGTITGELVPGTFQGAFLTGYNAGSNPPSTALTYTVDKLSFFGKVSPDHKTMTLTSANEIQTFTITTPTNMTIINYGICNYGRVLYRVSDRPDE